MLRMTRIGGCATMAIALSSAMAFAQGKQVALVKTPHGGIQPQAVIDAKGAVHLLYFKGEAKAGDLFYVRREPGKSGYSTPLRVNSQAGSAIAVGTIRGGQIALGKNGRVHVAWNGSREARPKGPGTGHPMLYARLNDTGAAFEEQRNLMTRTDILDGGGTVAADQAGNIYVAWHALETKAPMKEDNRQIWLARSSDEGKTFAAEVAVNPLPTGACGCCGMKAFVDSNGKPYFIYRGAVEGVHRDMYLLAWSDNDKKCHSSLLHRWEINACPMSSEAFAEGPNGIYTAWDTKGQIYFASVIKGTVKAGAPIAAPGQSKGRKHPALAVNAKGDMILVWTEGTAWQRGGGLAWQVYDQSGRPTADHGRLADSIPVWSLPTVVAEADGRFTIFH